MGLDVVEMVMAVETEFNLHIPDQEASELTTPGLLHAYVCRRLAGTPLTCPSQRAFHRLRGALVAQGVPRCDVTPDAALVALLPPGRTRWQALSAALGLRLPGLVRSARVEVGLATASLGWAGAAALLNGSAALLVGAPALWLLARAATVSLADHLPESASKVRGLVRALQAENPSSFPGRDRKWTEAQVWERLVKIIVEQLGVPEKAVTPTAEFVRDLGA